MFGRPRESGEECSMGVARGHDVEECVCDVVVKGNSKERARVVAGRERVGRRRGVRIKDLVPPQPVARNSSHAAHTPLSAISQRDSPDNRGKPRGKKQVPSRVHHQPHREVKLGLLSQPTRRRPRDTRSCHKVDRVGRRSSDMNRNHCVETRRIQRVSRA